MTKRILITPRSLTQRHSPDLEGLENAGYELVYARPGVTPTEQELLELVPGCVGWLAGVEPISERVLRAATNLKVISRNGTGVANIPVTLAPLLTHERVIVSPHIGASTEESIRRATRKAVENLLSAFD